MIPFLKLVADDLQSRFNGRFDDIAIVFPNKRAGLFLNKYLLETSKGRPFWSPRYMTISELFGENSELAIADPILLVSKLYDKYLRPRRDDESIESYEKSMETLDSFYYWGEMLVRDFDDIDKHLADPKQLFTNIKELKELGTANDVMSEEQKASILRFFSNFKIENESEEKEKFIDIWSRLYGIYTNFKQELRKENLAYEGMLYRDVIENTDNIVLKHNKYIFVGFNALSDVEKKMFKIVGNSGKALFYWDYDSYYISDANNEAGHFMRGNLEEFPNALGKEHFRGLSQDKKVTVVQSGNDSMSVRYIGKWLDSNLTENEIDTAIVLCDETMLEPTLHAIPESANGHELRYINVTMGYPITNTPIFALVKALVDLQTRGWSEKQSTFTLSYVNNVLKHPYVIQGSEKSDALRKELLNNKVFYPTMDKLCIDEFLTTLFTRVTDNQAWIESIDKLIYGIANRRAGIGAEKQEMYDELFCEAILKVHTQAQRLIKLLDNGDLKLKQATLGRLFIRMLSMQSMPFHGEPVMGLQIMGLLETRNLDFKNIIMLGVNEGNLPKNSSDNSFIPYNLRRAFGLTLSEHRDSIYAYYFYRLLQRAENVTLVYNDSSDSKTRGECSRYILQLLGSKLFDIERLSLTSFQNNVPESAMSVKKDDKIVDALRSKFDKGYSKEASPLTPSAINRYLRCGLNFYFYYILGLKPLNDADEDFKSNDFGTIFHKAAELFYTEISKKSKGVIYRSQLEEYIKNPALLYRFIDDAFKDEFFKGNKPVYNGEQYINRGVLHHFLVRLVKMDAGYTPFTYVGAEQKVFAPYTVKSGGNTIELNIGGTIDRIDIKGDTIEVVDYKTGGGEDKEPVASLDHIFNLDIKSAGYRLQAYLYSIVLNDVLESGIAGTNENRMLWIEKIKETAARKISPSLLYIHKEASREEYVIQLNRQPVKDITTLKDDYMIKLKGVLEEIFDPGKSFEPTCDDDSCKYCDYRKICGKIDKL